MPWDMRSVGTGFLEEAPYRFTSTEVIDRPAEEVFDAIASDPAGWGRWFPGFSTGGRYTTPAPHGVGSRRQVRMGGVAYEETVLVWERPHRWAFRVERAGAPVAYALAEEYRIVASGNRSALQWTFAMDPRPATRRVVPVLDPVLAVLLRRVASNLGRL